MDDTKFLQCSFLKSYLLYSTLLYNWLVWWDDLKKMILIISKFSAIYNFSRIWKWYRQTSKTITNSKQTIRTGSNDWCWCVIDKRKKKDFLVEKDLYQGHKKFKAISTFHHIHAYLWKFDIQLISLYQNFIF